MAKNSVNKNKQGTEVETSVPSTNNSVEEMDAVETSETKIVEQPVKETAHRTTATKKLDDLNDSDMIEVYSNVPNLSYYDKTTGTTIAWDNADDVAYMSVAEIKTMQRIAPAYLSKQYVYFEDERVNELFRLTEIHSLYKQLESFDLNDSAKVSEWKSVYEKLTKLNPASKSIIFSRITSSIEKGKLTNINSIKEIEGIYKVSGILIK